MVGESGAGLPSIHTKYGLPLGMGGAEAGRAGQDPKSGWGEWLEKETLGKVWNESLGLSEAPGEP